MLANIDNGGSVDIGNNRSISGRTHLMEVKQKFLWESQEEGIIEYHWVSMATNELDVFTKNQVRPEFNKHAAKLWGHDHTTTLHNM